MTNALSISKVKLKAKDTIIEVQFEVAVFGRELVDCKVEINEAPHPDLKEAMNALLPAIIQSNSLEEDPWLKDGRVTGLTIKEPESGEYGLVITAQKPSEDADAPPLANSPYLNSEYLWNEQKLIKKVIEEVELCLNGKRAQGSLFDTKPD